MDISSTSSTRNRSLYVRSALLLLLVAGIFVGIRLIGVERLQAFIDSAGIFAPLLYIALRALASVVAPFSSGPLQLASGILFGFIPAVIYSLIGSTLGYTTSFWIARRYGRGVVKRLLGENIERVDDSIRHLESWFSLAFARLVLSFAYDFIAYAGGLSKTPFRRFLVVTLLLGIPPIAVAVFIGLVGSGAYDLPWF
ncbi:MAG: VTT domain-containing protein [Chloroflexota bacterium]